jgi:hypothetical protein
MVDVLKRGRVTDDDPNRASVLRIEAEPPVEAIEPFRLLNT